MCQFRLLAFTGLFQRFGENIDIDLDLTVQLDTVQIEAPLDDVEARVRAVLPATDRVRVLLNSPEKPGLG